MAQACRASTTTESFKKRLTRDVIGLSDGEFHGRLPPTVDFSDFNKIGERMDQEAAIWLLRRTRYETDRR